MKYYTIVARETGSRIEDYATNEEAQKAIRAFEDEDKELGTYTPDFYEVIELDTADKKKLSDMTNHEILNYKA